MEEIFKLDGPLSKKISDYKYRSDQVDMASAIYESIESGEILVAEAGTGTGKTFAYLVPTFLHNRKSIISTGTKTLQDQLFNKDIPKIMHSLGVKRKVSLLKGRSNYVCHHFFHRTKEEGRFTSKEEIQILLEIEKYIGKTETGDRSNCENVPENSEVWDSVVSSRDNCLGSDCDFYNKCFVVKARSAALESDVVVVNHHLFFADILLRDVGLSELLPECESVVFDEAHLLPEVASIFFGDSLSTNQIIELIRDTRVEVSAQASDSKELSQVLDQLDSSVRGVIASCLTNNDNYAKSSFIRDESFSEAFENMMVLLKKFLEQMEPHKQRSDGLLNCYSRGLVHMEKLVLWNNLDKNLEFVSWTEAFKKSVHFNRTPLNVAKIFRNHLEVRSQAWIFISATLSIDNDFTHYIKQLGLEKAKTKNWKSPYNYSDNARLFLPRGLPDPNLPDYTEKVVDAAVPLIVASEGRTFFLFTSNRAMFKAEKIIREKMERLNFHSSILVQGYQPKSIILNRFTQEKNALLLGTMSFWEGVDVRGQSLSLVIIDRLPFGPPDDPVLQARIKKMKKEGLNPFLEYQLPKTILTLKQGSGRLIRDDNDRGVLMICDPRLVSKSYGKAIWRSLPPMTRSRDQEKIENFLRTKT